MVVYASYFSSCRQIQINFHNKLSIYIIMDSKKLIDLYIEIENRIENSIRRIKEDQFSNTYKERCL